MQLIEKSWLRGVDLNHRPLGYEPNELPDCSTPQSHPTVRIPGGQRWRLIGALLERNASAGRENLATQPQAGRCVHI